MKMEINISTAYDVKVNTPMDDSFPDDKICPNINRIERVAFSKCFLGLTAYNELKADLIDTSSLELWDPETTYAKDDNVIYEGEFLSSDIDANESSPDDANWSPMKKFITEGNNDLWNEGGLKYWLCLMIFYGTAKYNIYKNGANGFLKLEDDNAGGKTITLEEFRELKRGIKHDADDQLDLLKVYIAEKTKSEDCDDVVCTPKKKRRRRWHFIDDN